MLMYLTKDEEHVYNGESGWAKQTCMKILVRLGELFDAEKLIPIESAHVSGVSYKTLGKAPIQFLKALADSAKVQVRTTLNPQSLDSQYLRARIPESLKEPQLKILEQFDRMGLTKSLTCTPYYLQAPKQGSHNAWAESSAVVYTNSVLGAWTNREGGPSALAAAIIGKTPDYGIHKAENRIANINVKVEANIQSETEFGALGIFLGKTVGDKIPAIEGLPLDSKDKLKQLSAALATEGMISMFQTNTAGTKGNESINIERKQIEETIRGLSTASANRPDLVFIGCPHCSENEVKQIAERIKGKKVRDGMEFWVCTSCHIRQRTARYVRTIEEAGGQVLDGVCTIVSWTEQLGIKTIMTNSAKTAFYAPTLNRAETIFAPMQRCLEISLQNQVFDD